MTEIRLTAGQKKTISKWELNGYSVIKVTKDGVDSGDRTIELKKTTRSMVPLPKEFTENGVNETYHWHELQIRINRIGTEHISKLFNHESIIYPHCDINNPQASANYRAISDSKNILPTAYSDIDIQPDSTAIQCKESTIQRKVNKIDKTMSKKQQVNFRIDTDLLDALKQQAQVEGISYTDLIQRLCRQGLNGDSSKVEIVSNQFQSVDLTDTVKQLLYSDDIQKIIQTQVSAIVQEQLKT